MGFGGFLKKTAQISASVALKSVTEAASAGTGGLVVGAIKLATNKQDRVGQIQGALVGAVGGKKLQSVAELLDDIASLGKLVRAARADNNITADEMKSVLDAVEELDKDAHEVLKTLFG